MKRLLKWVGIVVGGLLAAILVAGFIVPSQWEVERSIVIEAKPAEIDTWVADLAKWPEWSSFDDQDPEMVMTLEGESTGVGARRSWVSPEMGNGAMWIAETDPGKSVRFKLQMEGMEPFDALFSYEAVDGGTKVVWKDWGDFGSNPFYRLIGSQMDSIVGPTFERGLEQLKAKVEAAPAPETTSPPKDEGD